MNTREAIVLAGGLGSRLQSVLPDIPKCMAPVDGKPFLTYILDFLIDKEFDKVILSVGYRKEQIINYFGDSYKSAELVYSVENEPLGTGGAIKLSFNHCVQDDVFVLNGDTYFMPDLNAMEANHFQKSADITIAVKRMHDTGRYGLVIIDSEGRITDFREKDPVSEGGWINGGIYLFNRKVIETFPEHTFSLENDFFKLSCPGFNIRSFQTDAFFLDLGIPEDYLNAPLLIKTHRKV